MIPAADVKRIVERLELNVLALINPDGRAFSQSSNSERAPVGVDQRQDVEVEACSMISSTSAAGIAASA